MQVNVRSGHDDRVNYRKTVYSLIMFFRTLTIMVFLLATIPSSAEMSCCMESGNRDVIVHFDDAGMHEAADECIKTDPASDLCQTFCSTCGAPGVFFGKTASGQLESMITRFDILPVQPQPAHTARLLRPPIS